MSTLNIKVNFDKTRKVKQEVVAEEKFIDISISLTDSNRIVDTNIFSHLLEHNLVLKDQVFDLLRIAISIYSIDQVVSRKIDGFQGWSRHLKINLPVYEPKLWQKSKPELDELLSYLSGDKWDITFRKNAVVREVQSTFETNANHMEAVCLFSGGLDSFIASIDLLSEKKKVAFVSHYKASESSVQQQLYDMLETKFGRSEFEKHKIRVQPRQQNNNAKENTSRARSFLFLCLGIAIANSHGDQIPLIVPENGLISLNVPLTKTRLSSHSTRTTHPYYLKKFKKLLLQLGIENDIINPYQFKTKGEMMTECKNLKLLKKYYPFTVSCSHPENSRFAKKRPGLNCGYCVPCIIRQAAEKKAGKILTEYAYDITKELKEKKREDLRAFKIGLANLEALRPEQLSLQLLRSGPLPYKDSNELRSFIELYQRGMLEVSTFLKK